MPRRRRSFRPAPRPRPAPACGCYPPPQTVNHAPPPAFRSNSDGGIGSTIARGIAFGIGNAIASSFLKAVSGPQTIQHETVASEAAAAAAAAPAAATSTGGSEACGTQTKAFQDCLNGNMNVISKCQFYMDMLADCRRNSGSMVS